jgi:hypothetical protein
MVVGIEQRDPLPTRHPDAGVARSARAAIAVETDETDLDLRADGRQTKWGPRAIVDDDQLHARHILRAGAQNRALAQLLSVEDRNDDGNLGHRSLEPARESDPRSSLGPVGKTSKHDIARPNLLD